jgi:hypothetical protein
LPPFIESLENKLLLTQTLPLVPPGTGGTPTTGGLGLYTLASGSTVRIEQPGTGAGSTSPTSVLPTDPASAVILDHLPVAYTGTGPAQQFSGPIGYIPSQIIGAYGINLISFGGIKGNGAGQTIGIFEEGSNPAFVDTSSPSYSTSALAVFDRTFGIPDPPSLTFYDGNGNPITPSNPGPGDEGAGVEIALDIEWLHAIAPDAAIDVLNAVPQPNNYYEDIPLGMATLAGLPHVSVVSVSYGWYLEYLGQGALEATWDQTIIQPAATANPNVAFFAASGDNGSFATNSLIYPSVSPEVVAVGGTSLFINGQNQWTNEIGWSGSGGGYSTVFAEPPFQENDGFNNGGFRTVPDVSAEADPNTGVAVYDPYDFGASTPWDEIGGTSLATPLWAGMAAIADQGRIINGGTNLGATQALSFLYNLSTSDYHDITVGNSGLYSAGPGYDLVTGIGSPKANILLPQLAAAGLATQAAVSIEPPTSVIAGGLFGTVIQAEDSSGAVDPGFNGTATLFLFSGPVGATFTPITLSFKGGLAVFDGVSLSQLSLGTNYQFEVSITGLSISPLQPNPVDVATAATSGVSVFYPMPIDSSIRNDVALAGSDSNSLDNIYLVYAQTYGLANGELVVQNTSGLGTKTIQFLSHDEFAGTAPVISGAGLSRVFDVIGLSNGATNLSVFFKGLSQGLVIENGLASDDGGLPIPSGTAVGGGLLVDGGAVTLNNVTMKDNEVLGRAGVQGSSGGSATSAPGGPGKPGGNAQGGAIYIAAGTLTLDNDAIMGNIAKGGVGGVGGTGGNALEFITIDGFTSIEIFFMRGGPGGTGGVGGVGAGGALYVAGGSVSITGGSMTGNQAVGGAGGQGGFGGHGGTVQFPGGTGGLGGIGGSAQGGGIYLDRGSLNLSSANVNDNKAAGGKGGAGGTGGTGGYSLSVIGRYGQGGDGGIGGLGGNGSGGGMYVLSGTISWLNSNMDFNQATAGAGGAAGKIGFGAGGGVVGTAGLSGSGIGGGIFDQGTLTLTGATIEGNKADNGGGIDIHGTLTLNSSHINDNTATDNGGGINITGVIYVNQSDFTGDSATLGGAIDSSGTFTLTGGELSNNTATQSGGGIYSSGKGTISGTEFLDNSGSIGGGIYSFTNSILNVSNAQFYTNSAVNGGAIYNLASVQISGTVFSGNMATGGANNGGAILNNKGTVTVTGSTFTGNTGTNGGAIDSIQGTLTVTGGSFSENSANGFGGAIDSSGTATINGVTFASNSATSGKGGAIYDQGTLSVSGATTFSLNKAKFGGGIANAGTLKLVGATFGTNMAIGAGNTGSGGGIYNSAGGVSISGGSFSGNSATGVGGGIFVSEGSLTISADTTLSLNSAYSGGAIGNALGTVSLTNVTLSQNSATTRGGSIYNANSLVVTIASFFNNDAASGGSVYNTGTANITDVTLSSDSASSMGGGIFNSGTIGLANSTIADESAEDGAGAYNSAGTMTAVNVTIAENHVQSGGTGGGLDVAGGTVILYNTIISANTNGVAIGAPADDIAGLVSALSTYNLIGSGGSGGLVDKVNNNLVGEAPNLGSLGTNGGPTETIALLANSPAIDAGGNSISGVTIPTSDQRGALRGGTSGLTGINAGLRVDIGAFEASSSYLVTTTVDSLAYGTLRSAVGWANLSVNYNPANIANPAPNTVVFDTVNVFSTPRTITLTQGTLEFFDTTVPESIQGNGVANLTVSGANSLTPFLVDQDVTVSMSGFTISGGNGVGLGAGGAIANDGTLTLTGMAISKNTAPAGGGVWNESLGTLSVNSSTFSGNTASSDAGGAIESEGSLTINGSTFSGNSAFFGGAVDATGPLGVTASTFSGNSATLGGAIYNSSSSAATIASSTFSGNSATNGGAIYNASSEPLLILDSTVKSNTAAMGAGVFNFSGTATLTDSTFAGNAATVGGGGAYNQSGTLNVIGSTFSSNSASVTGSGGGIWNNQTLSLTNVTFAGNSALFGGGVDNESPGALTAINVTFAYNTVATGGAGGALNLATGTTNDLFNTIVALNTIGSGSLLSPSDIAGTVDAASANNLIGTGGSGGLTNGTNGNLVGVTTPGLASGLANNGGPTQTIALALGSPAIDAGANSIGGQTIPTVDQRGAIRGPAGLNAGAVVDIGAYEASSSYLVSTLTDSTAVGTLRSALGWANVSTNANPEQVSNPVPNTIDFGLTGTITLSLGAIALTNTTTNLNIDGNGITVSGGGVSGVFTVASGVTVAISNLTITGGVAANNGGGIDNSGALTLTDVTVSGNAATLGGGIANEAAATLLVTDSILTGNTAIKSGGGLENMGIATLLHDTISLNTAASGAGIANVLSGVLIPNGSGGVIPAPANLAITDSTINNNAAAGGNGGGIDNTGAVTIGESTINNNSATAIGGGIGNETGGSFIATNVTIVQNTAASGGGIGNIGTSAFVSSTIAYNTATAAGGGLYISGGTGAIYDSIVAANYLGTVTKASDISVASTGNGKVGPTSSYNLIGSGGAGGLSGNGNVILAKGVSPGLAAALANNGGPTKTIALLSGSPAIDMGNTSIPGANIPITDQRGALRGPGGLDAGAAPDAGAFEASSSYLVTSTSVRPDVGTIETAVGWANISTNVNPANPAGNPAANTVVFDSAAGATFATPQTITLSSGPLVFTDVTSVPKAIDGSGTTGLVLSGGGSVGVLVVDAGVTATIFGLTISGGSATSGGAIDNFGNLTINDATFSRNASTSADGGAIENEADATLSVLNSTFSGNEANESGGAIFNFGTATITDSTFAGNSANEGGAIGSDGTLIIVSATIADNTALSDGGGLAVLGGTTTLYDTIVAQNTTTTPVAASDISGTVSASSSYNLIDDAATAGGLTNGTNGNIVGLSAGLATAGLANNGGPTETIALVAGSPALSTGAAAITGVVVPGFDQRGVMRNPEHLNNGTTIDIGAYEDSPIYLVTTGADSLGSGTLRSAIAWANSTPSSNLSGPLTIMFDPTIFNASNPQTITLSQSLGTLALTNTSASLLIQGPGAGYLTISGGGAIELFSVGRGVTVTLTNLTLADGLSSSGGAITNQGDLTLTNDTFTSNQAVYYGGAIYNLGGTLEIANSTFTGNIAPFGLGGAIDNAGTATITTSVFTGGTAYQGGAIDNKSGTLSISYSSLYMNSGTLGGAIFNNATAVIASCLIANDDTSFDGGGIANDLGGTMTIVNSTVAFNHSGQTGGGINQVGGGNGATGSLTVINSTIAYNSVNAGGAGGGIDASSGTTNLYNTIVALNTAGTPTSSTASDISGTASFLSAYNLIGTGGSGGLISAVNGNQVAVANPGLATALANNGGPTETIALLAGSPAIDAGKNSLAVDANGNPLVYDQRGPGFPRIVNSIVDIGAFERALATNTTLKSSANPSVIGQVITFTATVAPAKTSSTVPTGTISFYVGSVLAKVATLVAGVATYTTSSLPLGSSTITAVYSGDQNYATSTSAVLTQAVNTTSSPTVSSAAATAPLGSAAATSPPSFSAATVVVGKHNSHTVKKKAVVKKALPHAGSTTKFHQTKQSAALKKSVSLVTKHAAAKPKTKVKK